jgi:hypothetical protein
MVADDGEVIVKLGGVVSALPPVPAPVVLTVCRVTITDFDT